MSLALIPPPTKLKAAVTNKQTPLSVWLDSQIGKGKPYPSNRAFARAAGIGESTVRGWRHGESPNLQTLQTLAEHLGVPIEMFVHEKIIDYAEADKRIQERAPQLYALIEETIDQLGDEGILLVTAAIKAVLKTVMGRK